MSQFELAGPLQTEILRTMWDPVHKGKQWTVSDIREVMNRRRESRNEKPLAYTTFLTVLRNLSRRGFTNQENTGCRAHIFTPKMKRSEYEQGLFGSIISTLYDNNINQFAEAVIALRDSNLQNNGG